MNKLMVIACAMVVISIIIGLAMQALEMMVGTEIMLLIIAGIVAVVGLGFALSEGGK